MNESKNITALDPDMTSAELDDVTLDSSQKIKGILLFLICTVIGIAVFFCSITHADGSSETIFSFLYNGFLDLFGSFVYWILCIIIALNFGVHVYARYIDKGKTQNIFLDAYSNTTPVHTVLFGLGLIYVVVYTAWMNLGMNAPEFIVSDLTGGNVIPPICKGVFGIILVGAIFMPFLLNYGVLEIIGAILEPLMRPLFKVPGKAALDATASFVSSSSLGVLITNRLWKNNVYTEKEMVAIMTGFSAVSIGFAGLVINTAGCGDMFAKIYGISFLMVFLIEIVMVRIPPIRGKKDVFYNGREQSPEERRSEVRFTAQTIPRGFTRAVKRAAIARGVHKDIGLSLKDSVIIMPQVLTMISGVGVSAMIIAEYTPVFKYLGYLFQPLLLLCQVPDAAAIAPSMPVGLAEMFLPVLVMNGTAAAVTIGLKARVFVCLVSMVQIIFFSETATVMLATKSPIRFWELIVCFIERTIMAIPVAAVAIHLFF
ncbi:MAG: YjiH family protein [Anaerovoracaceae bacterium]